MVAFTEKQILLMLLSFFCRGFWSLFWRYWICFCSGFIVASHKYVSSSRMCQFVFTFCISPFYMCAGNNKTLMYGNGVAKIGVSSFIQRRKFLCQAPFALWIFPISINHTYIKLFSIATGRTNNDVVTTYSNAGTKEVSCFAIIRK